MLHRFLLFKTGKLCFSFFIRKMKIFFCGKKAKRRQKDSRDCVDIFDRKKKGKN